MFAAEKGQLQTVQELLKRGANIDAQNYVMWGTGALTLTRSRIFFKKNRKQPDD